MIFLGYVWEDGVIMRMNKHSIKVLLHDAVFNATFLVTQFWEDVI